MNNQRGLFIVLEGLDRCGKTTQTKLVSEKLNAEVMQFPDRTTALGGIISSYLKGSTDMKDEVIHLLFSANRWEQCERIKQTLQKGTHIVCDRYAYSGVAFSAAKGLDIDWCKNTDSGLPKPDLVIFLKAPINSLSERGDFGNERYETIKFQEKVGEIFEGLIKSERMIVIDALKSRDEVKEQILNQISEFNQQMELQQLWK